MSLIFESFYQNVFALVALFRFVGKPQQSASPLICGWFFVIFAKVVTYNSDLFIELQNSPKIPLEYIYLLFYVTTGCFL